MDEVSDAMSVLAEGHQWYWSYQYPDFLNGDDEFIEFDSSYLVAESYLEGGSLVYPMDIADILNPATASQPSGPVPTSGSGQNSMSTIIQKLQAQLDWRLTNSPQSKVSIYNDYFGDNAINTLEHNTIRDKLVPKGYVEKTNALGDGIMCRSSSSTIAVFSTVSLIKDLTT